MKSPYRCAALVALLPALAGVVPEALAQATSAAESACMEAVNRNYGGRVRDLRVLHSEFSQANSRVIIEADGERWNCLSSNDGYVEELKVEAGGRHDSGYQQGSGSGGGVTIYGDYGFRGASETIHGNVVDMKQTRVGNDALSSIRVPSGCTAILYSDNNYRGHSLELYGDEPELGRTRVGNDSVSSIEVRCGGHGGGHNNGNSGSHAGSSGEGVTLYGDYGFRGASETFRTGEIADLKGTRIGNDAVSSVRVPRGCTVMLFADNNFRGRSIELTRDEPELGRTAVGNDSVSSISVSCN
jgi:hypothetical protein